MHSIRRQLIRTLTLVIAGLLAAGLVLVYFAQREALTEQFDDTLLTQATILNRAVAAADAAHTPLTALRDPRGERGKPREFFEVRRTNGELLLQSQSLDSRELDPPEFRSGKPVFWSLKLPTGRRGRAVATIFPAALPGDEARRVVFAGDRDELDEALRSSLVAIASAAILLLLAIVILVPRVLRRALRPLDDFAQRVAAIDSRSLDSRLDAAAAPEELAPVAHRLNELLARLEQSFERERRVSADLAHELRTPVAELRLLAENALKWPASRDPATDSDALAIARQMESIVERMLALARSETGALVLEFTPVDLVALTHQAWQPFAPRAAARALAVTFCLPLTTVTTDAVLLRSVVSNLLDNAADYATSGGVIAIACGQSADGRAWWQVSNPTENLTADDVARLFERFWRKDAARSEGAHVGLGLSLVQAFTAALGWEVEATLDSARVLTFTLREKRRTAPAA